MKRTTESVFFDKIYPHFQKISSLERPSGEERELVDFIIRYANDLKLKVESDAYGNIAVYRDASIGLNPLQPLLFQGHLDMVCVPDKNIFPIQPIITEGWVHAENSTLGADNGIAVAYMLELMRMPFEKNPPLEFLFTVSEEVGLMGASTLETEKIHIRSSKLINLDSEEIKCITVGCAGGQDLEIQCGISHEANSTKTAAALSVKGPGGHSGLVIHERIPNAIRIAAECLHKIGEKHSISIAKFSGGFARNAIPAEARVIVCSETSIEDEFRLINDEISKKYKDFQPFQMSIASIEPQDYVLSHENTRMTINLVLNLPHGVMKINKETGGVLSSVNLALITTNSKYTEISMNIRSSEAVEIMEILNKIDSISTGFTEIKIKRGDSYPGWRPNLNSGLLQKTSIAFEEVTGKKPKYLDIHAGLECGILMDKFSTIQEAVSIGPNILNAHSINERLEIASTIKIWEIIKKLIDFYSSPQG